jgi:hypothetical protein
MYVSKYSSYLQLVKGSLFGRAKYFMSFVIGARMSSIILLTLNISAVKVNWEDFHRREKVVHVETLKTPCCFAS